MTLSKEDILRIIELIETAYPKMIDGEVAKYEELHSRLQTQLCNLTI
jgi:hypothetical protein